MHVEVFHFLLDRICAELTKEAQTTGFTKAFVFENRVREVAQEQVDLLDRDTEAQQGPLAAFSEDLPLNLTVDMVPPAQAFPDIVLGDVGIEVKFTESDTWRCIANSVLETNKVHSVSI